MNGYFKFGDGIEPYLGRLERVVRNFRGKKIVVSVDANAKCLLWFSAVTDERGMLLEDAILALELEVLNVESEVITFENTRGLGKNIDVTMVSWGLVSNVMSWQVKEELFISDHRMIVFQLSEGLDCKSDCNDVRPGSFVFRMANWLMFDWLIVKGVESMGEIDVSVNEEVRMLERTIKDTCYGSIPAACAGEKVSWWTEAIEELRRSKSKLEKSWKRCRRNFGSEDFTTVVVRDAYVRKRNDIHGRFGRKKEEAGRTCWYRSRTWILGGKFIRLCIGKLRRR